MKKIITFIFILLSLPIMAINLKNDTIPQQQMYTVDFDGQQFAFIDPRTNEPPTSLYAAGEAVIFRLELVATDTSYRFFLDGEEIQPSYINEQFGYCFYFAMPAHDVKFTYTTRNTMIYDPSEDK